MAYKYSEKSRAPYITDTFSKSESPYCVSVSYCANKNIKNCSVYRAQILHIFSPRFEVCPTSIFNSKLKLKFRFGHFYCRSSIFFFSAKIPECSRIVQNSNRLIDDIYKRKADLFVESGVGDHDMQRINRYEAGRVKKWMNMKMKMEDLHAFKILVRERRKKRAENQKEKERKEDEKRSREEEKEEESLALEQIWWKREEMEGEKHGLYTR